MGNQERISSILGDISRFFRDYKTLMTDGLPGDDDTIRFHAMSMILFTILNLSFELGEEIITMKKAGVPHSYREIFSILHQEGIIDSDLTQSMSRLVYYRNRLAHQYSGLNREDFQAIISRMDDIRRFSSIMQEVGLSDVNSLK